MRPKRVSFLALGVKEVALKMLIRQKTFHFSPFGGGFNSVLPAIAAFGFIISLLSMSNYSQPVFAEESGGSAMDRVREATKDAYGDAKIPQPDMATWYSGKVADWLTEELRSDFFPNSTRSSGLEGEPGDLGKLDRLGRPGQITHGLRALNQQQHGLRGFTLLECPDFLDDRVRR